MRNPEITDAPKSRYDNNHVMASAHNEVFQSWTANSGARQDANRQGENPKHLDVVFNGNIYAAPEAACRAEHGGLTELRPGEHLKGKDESTLTEKKPGTSDGGVNSQVPGDANKLPSGILSKLPKGEYQYYGDPGMVVTPKQIETGPDRIMVLPDNFTKGVPAFGDKITTSPDHINKGDLNRGDKDHVDKLPNHIEKHTGFTKINALELQRLNSESRWFSY